MRQKVAMAFAVAAIVWLILLRVAIILAIVAIILLISLALLSSLGFFGTVFILSAFLALMVNIKI
jgi:hypothetical protein